MEAEYPFEIVEINPIYLSEQEAANRMEQIIAQLLEILDGE